jgi:hypothetical protein
MNLALAAQEESIKSVATDDVLTALSPSPMTHRRRAIQSALCYCELLTRVDICCQHSLHQHFNAITYYHPERPA